MARRQRTKAQRRQSKTRAAAAAAETLNQGEDMDLDIASAADEATPNVNEDPTFATAGGPAPTTINSSPPPVFVSSSKSTYRTSPPFFAPEEDMTFQYLAKMRESPFPDRDPESLTPQELMELFKYVEKKLAQILTNAQASDRPLEVIFQIKVSDRLMGYRAPLEEIERQVDYCVRSFSGFTLRQLLDASLEQTLSRRVAAFRVYKRYISGYNLGYFPAKEMIERFRDFDFIR
ncbi:hypothetical protein QBC44DRAFT_367603 [Cladorrhinum sp. PSN332]|nr:hypothetical protein QBC44DRAFT_367603 [Cladorrhinum sp. PSN332]